YTAAESAGYTGPKEPGSHSQHTAAQNYARHIDARTLHAQHVRSFREGTARNLSPKELSKDGVFVSKPLEGSTFTRRKPVQFIVLHSTETLAPAGAPRVIDSWNNRGGHGKHLHPGAQFVVDRDGKIYSTCDPNKVTIHVNNRITKGG